MRRIFDQSICARQSKTPVGTPGGIRTLDKRLRRALLYPAELRAHSGAGDGNRTHVVGLEGRNSTIELHLHVLIKHTIFYYICQRFLLTSFKRCDDVKLCESLRNSIRRIPAIGLYFRDKCCIIVKRTSRNEFCVFRYRVLRRA